MDSGQELISAMEPCKGFVQTSTSTIHVVTVGKNLRFSILASTWLPRALGVLLWSVLHMLLLLVLLVVVLAIHTIMLLIALSFDVVMILMVVISVVTFLLSSLIFSVVAAVVWVYLVISCQCCTLPPRAPGRSRWDYFLSVGETFHPPTPPRAPADGMCEDGPPLTWAAVKDESYVWKCLKQVAIVDFPICRLEFQNLCAEVVPLADHIVVR